MKTPIVSDKYGNVIVQDPPIAQLLFSNTRLAWLWLVVRLWVGYQWIDAGRHKLEDPAWMETGQGILGFWQRAAAVAPGGKSVVAFDWYRAFLQLLVDSGSHPWFAKIIVFGELAVGLGLIVGALVGIASFFGALMNMSFLLAGTASTNPALFAGAVLLMLAWKTAGWYGLDRYLLPLLGTPWQHHIGQTEPVATARPRPATLTR
ncbi:MAG: DoxX family protein [Chloroflexi bacterium]|nr:DoxX family protein [Chloroflexota bacterium]